MANPGPDNESAERGPGREGGEGTPPGWPRRWQPWQVVVPLAVVIALAVGTLVAISSSSTKQRVSTAPSATSAPAATIQDATTTTASSTTPASTTTPSSAASDLAPYFAAAAREDTKLTAAATLVNGGITKTEVTFDQATVDAVRSLDPKGVADTIPNGLEPELKRDVLLVYSDIMSRTMAMHLATAVGTYPMSDYPAKDLLSCLHNGALAAARYPRDLAAAKKLAAHSPPVVAVAADSRAAEDLAVRLADIDLENSGCASCGGYTPTELVPITWFPQPKPIPPNQDTFVGEIWATKPGSGVPFNAKYDAATGWTVQINAC